MTFVLVNSTVDFAQDSLLSNAILFRNRSDRAEINLLKIDCRKSSQTSEINNTLLSSTATSYHAIAVESLDCEYFPQCGGGGYPKLQSFLTSVTMTGGMLQIMGKCGWPLMKLITSLKIVSSKHNNKLTKQ